MKEKVNDSYKKTSYYVIDEDEVFIPKSSNYDDILDNCIYIKKLGFSSRPIFFYNIKKDGSWIKKNIFVKNYPLFIDLIANNKPNVICLRGFSKGEINQLINNLKNSKNINVSLVDSIDRFMNTKYFKERKEKTLNELRELRKELKEKYGSYNKGFIAEFELRKNSIINREKIKSRRRMNRILFDFDKKNT